MVHALAILASLALAAPPSPRSATPVEVDAKDARERPAKSEDLSRGGTQTGALELGLGSLALGITGLLIGRGVWELVTGAQLVQDCRNGTTADVLCARKDPARGHKVAGGLALGFAVPIAVAGSLLIARGARIRRDYRKFQRQERAVALTGNGLVVRF